MKLTLGRIVAASMAFAGLVFLTMAAGSIYSIRQMISSADMVAHTEEVETRLNGVLAWITEWESANRNYLITGDKSYLASYADAKAELKSRVDYLQALVVDNPDETANVKQLRQLAQDEMDVLAKTPALPARTGPDPRVQVITAGAQEMNDIKALITKMRGMEDDLLTKRRDENKIQATQSIAAAITTSAVGLAVLGVAGLVIVRQLTQREKAEWDLAHKTTELQGIIDHSPMGIFLKDLNSRYLLLNAAMKPLLGAEPAACLGKGPAELFPAERAAAILDEDGKTLAEGHPQKIDLELKFADGTVRYYQTHKFILRDASGKVYALGGITQDVTERRQLDLTLHRALDTAEAASRTKSQFLANMSHELRTPLNSIIGFSEILSDKLFGTLNDKQQQYVGNILASGRHLLLLINDLLDLAKIEAGKMSLDPERTEVAGLVRDGINLVRGTAERKGVAIEVEETDAELAARLDPARAKQIIYNLVSNAVKFTPKGGQVTITAKKLIEPACPERGGPRGCPAGQRLAGEWLLLTVSDTGIGIAPEDLERIFAEFEQVDSTYARQQEGTGLGLTLTAKLADMHGGGVWAESPGRIDEGSAFHVLLPLTGPPREVEKRVEKPRSSNTVIRFDTPEPFRPAPKPGANGRPLVLMIEDDLSASHLMREHLIKGGYDVAHATTGEDALRLAASLRPAAITLDILLPDANGMDVLARLKATRVTSHIPVVIVSVTDDRQLGMSLGAAEFFVKPVSAEKLLSALDRVAARVQRAIQHVLVVDDEPIARESIIAVLEPRGYHVLATESGEEALRVIAEHPPDVAIIDLTMPGMSGFELVNYLRQNPATRELPICIYTAKDLTASEMHWLHQQSAAVTAKPFREQLLSELQRVCADTS